MSPRRIAKINRSNTLRMQRIADAEAAMRRLRDTFHSGNNRFGEYGRNVRDAYNNHAKTYAELTGLPAPSIYD
jgi:hypothetical protein